MARMEGTVAWFNEQKGFGFISAGDGRDVLVQYDEIERDGFRTLTVGERVTFELGDEDKGPKALRVRPLTPDRL